MADYSKIFDVDTPVAGVATVSTSERDIKQFVPVNTPVAGIANEISVDPQIRSNVDSCQLYRGDLSNYADYTDEANEDTADDVVLSYGSAANDDYLYIGSTGTFAGFEIKITTAGAGTYTISNTAPMQYWNGSTWASISQRCDEDDFKSVQNNWFAWHDDLSDWTQVSVDGGPQLYFVRLVYTTGTVTTIPLAGRVWILNFELITLYNTRATMNMMLGMGWQIHRDFQLAKRGETFDWLFVLTDIADYATPKTGVTGISVEVSRDGGSFASEAGSVTEIGNGMYKKSITNSDYSILAIQANASGCAQSDEVILMV